MNKIQKGFTLIELMIVVAIIAILAAIAIPAYQDYVIRSQVSEGMSLADGAKTAMAEFYSNRGHFPTNNASAGLATNKSIKGKYTTQLDLAPTKGQIQVTFGNQANDKITNKIVTLSAITHAGSTEFSCKGSTVDKKYLPSSCRDDV